MFASNMCNKEAFIKHVCISTVTNEFAGYYRFVLIGVIYWFDKCTIQIQGSLASNIPDQFIIQDVCILSPVLSSSYDKLNCCFSQGMNSIFMYVAHLVFQHYFPVSFYVDETSHWATLAMHLWGPGFWCLVTYKMFSSDMFISI